MNNKILVLNLDFSVLRKLEDNSAVNTTIIQRYELILLNGIKFPELLKEIKEDFDIMDEKIYKQIPFSSRNGVKEC